MVILKITIISYLLRIYAHVFFKWSWKGSFLVSNWENEHMNGRCSISTINKKTGEVYVKRQEKKMKQKYYLQKTNITKIDRIIKVWVIVPSRIFWIPRRAMTMTSSLLMVTVETVKKWRGASDAWRLRTSSSSHFEAFSFHCLQPHN